MAEAAVKTKPETAPEAEQDLTDGFHLIIDALKLNGLTTIYGVPGIPITDFGRMAQASGMMVLAFSDFASMPFLMSVDGAKMRTFVEPGAVLDIEAVLEHDGSGFAVTKAKITSDGKKVCDAQLKLRTMPFSEIPLGPIVKKRAEEVGLMAAIAADAQK